MMDIFRSWLACDRNPHMSLASHTDVDARHAMPPWAIIAPFLHRPTVCLDVISLVASSCGYNRGQIEQRVAH